MKVKPAMKRPRVRSHLDKPRPALRPVKSLPKRGDFAEPYRAISEKNYEVVVTLHETYCIFQAGAQLTSEAEINKVIPASACQRCS
jgi:hypothetical protein